MAESPELTDAGWHPLSAPAAWRRDAVHVLRIVCADDAVPPSVHAALDAHEARRAARLRDSADRRRFVLGRLALRAVLGAWAELAPQALQLVEGAHGKPMLAGNAQHLFNLSHSGAVVLLAWADAAAAGGALGVDVEQLRPVRDLDALARTALPHAACEALQALPAPQRLPAFFGHWVEQEALLKAQGLGLAGLDAQRTAGAAALPGWALHRLDPAPGHPAALACARQGMALQRWHATPTALAALHAAAGQTPAAA